MRRTLAALLWLTPALALADIPPPEGYVERCTVEENSTPERECQRCDGAYHGDRDKCARELTSGGWARACRTRGASVWGEVWCRPKAAATATTAAADLPVLPGSEEPPKEPPLVVPDAGDPAPPARRCSVAPGEVMLALALLALPLGLRRRR